MNMSEPHEKLTYYIEYKGFTMPEFCKQFGFVYSTFTQIAKGTRPLGRQIQDKIVSAFPNLNVNWLLYDRGPMELGEGVSEPGTGYNRTDPFKKMFLTYLEDADFLEQVKDKLKK